jgi:excisionase family DNA binding protein
MVPLLLTPEEAARALRVSRSKLYELARSGKIPTIRIGSVLRIPRRRLEALIDGDTESSDQ